jgi:DNA-binding CsgD family transcriptional regulator
MNFKSQITNNTYCTANKQMQIQPITKTDFKEIMLRPKSSVATIDLQKYFEPYIKQAENFAAAPYFWLIPNQESMTLVAASENIRTLTPYNTEEWVGQDSNFWLNAIHQDDQGFLGAVISMAVKVQETMTEKRADNVRLNVYCRMLNADSKYRWVLIQFPKKYFNEANQIVSTLILTTDLSHLDVELKCMMTLIDPSENKFDFFSASLESQSFLKLDLPSISKREHQVLLLMTKGLNSPEIAEKLFISYNTVENHKRNLRKKTNTKTSAELIHFVWSHNLI